MKLIPLLIVSAVLQAGEVQVRVSWGHESKSAAPYDVRFFADNGLELRAATAYSLESGEGERDGAWRTKAGAGDIDGASLSLAYPSQPSSRRQNLHVIWADLIAGSDADTAARLSRDPAFLPGAPKLTIQMNEEGTRGFSVTVDQLLREKAIWVPSHGIYLTAGEPVPFESHRRELARWRGRRVIDRLHRETEANYEQYKSRWPDMGHPSYTHARSTGQIVCLAWDSAIPKFGVDRWAGVSNDLGNPDRFQFWFELNDPSPGLSRTWKGQRLEDGLPVLTTTFENDGVRYDVEQFVYPLNGPPTERRGDIPMVLLQRVRAAELRGAARRIAVAIGHRRLLPKDAVLTSEERSGAVLFGDGSGGVLLTVQGAAEVEWSGVRDYQKEQKRLNATIFADLPAKGSREFVVKLPSPAVKAAAVDTLLAIDHAAARRATLGFWEKYLAAGARFRVPEKAINDLVRANLWHALRLPRRHGGEGDNVKIDLPYSNFAYGQTGTPWPVNQAVYVDYMLYDLRGHHGISVEELLAQFRNNQGPDGWVGGVAKWGVYTPGMLYAVAQNYLLSRDRAAFEKLLAPSLRAMDWCLAAVRKARERSGPTRGLILAPLNDGTGDGIWAFNQAYLYAGLQLFGTAMREAGHPRAAEALATAAELRDAIARGFGSATLHSPLAQLRDHTWIPYVPCEASTHGRILDQWYATDVDTGAVHLPRLDALPPDGELTDFLLNDHEDNLFLKGWGMANEPVYNQHGMTYLRRDDPKAAIRTFYSYMASAFSHSVFEPVEHRWTHGQYFGPPSTDGAFFELFRNMIVRELGDGTLLIGQATPRKWLENGRKIEVEKAPTYFGPLSVVIESRAASGTILATLNLPAGTRPKTLLVRLRHPAGKRMQSATVNGTNWTDFSAEKEWVRIANPKSSRYEVVAAY